MKLIQISEGQMLLNNKVKLINYSLRQLPLLVFVVLLIVSIYPYKSVQAIEPNQIPQVQKIVEAFKQNNRIAVAKLVSYPLLRQAPLTPIRTEHELLSRYDVVFDQVLLRTITQSNIYTDWDSIGWRGVILNNGIVAIDPDGNITEVNYHSPREQALVNKLNSNSVAKGRRSLHRSVTDYKQAVVELTTPRFRIRVDNVGDDKRNLRYTAWPVNKNTSEAPDLILNNGRVYSSNGRNQHYVFNNGNYSYQLNINSKGLSSHATGSLVVVKNGKPWLREKATKVIHR